MAKTKRVLGKPLPNASLPRNAFDRSVRINFNSFAGGLFPVFAEPFQKGSRIKLNRSIFQRTADVNTAAFPIIDTHVEFFEVPLRQLWTPWYNWKLNIQDYNSSEFGVFGQGSSTWNAKIFDSVPSFDVMRVVDQMFTTYRTTTSTSIFGTSKKYALDACRLLDLLGYGSYKLEAAGSSTSSTLQVNPFKLAAYQKIYYDHFRNTAYESNNPYPYNLDYESLHSSSSSPVVSDRWLAQALQLHYVNYRRDYFTNLYPALNYVVSTPTGLSWQIPSSVVGLASQAIQINNNLTASASAYTGSTGNDNNRWSDITSNQSNVISYQSSGTTNGNLGTASNGIWHTHDASHNHNITLGGSITGQLTSDVYNVQNIRAAFALDKLLRQTSYAPKHVKDQMEARFGIKGTENDKESIRIASFKNDIVIGEVTQTAPGQDSSGSYQPLGTIGGKGVGGEASGRDIEYTCKDDCIVMGVMYTLPRASYDSNFIKNWNAKQSREDFFQPEFMDLGLQPLHQYEWYQPTDGSFTIQDANRILGYVPRYQEYKLNIDTNHLLFNSGRLLSPFAVHTNVGHRSYRQVDGEDYLFFKVRPEDLDSIFVTQYDPFDMLTDQFINSLEIKCISNQDMSVHGQPRL